MDSKNINRSRTDDKEVGGVLYVMVNSDNGATVECTSKYVLMWIARGFTVKEIRKGSISLEVKR